MMISSCCGFVEKLDQTCHPLMSVPLHPHVAHQLLVQRLLQEDLTDPPHVPNECGSQNSDILPDIIDGLTGSAEDIVNKSVGLSRPLASVFNLNLKLRISLCQGCQNIESLTSDSFIVICQS